MTTCHKCNRGIAEASALFKTATATKEGVVISEEWTCWGCMTLEQKQHINPLLMDALEEQQ